MRCFAIALAVVILAAGVVSGSGLQFLAIGDWGGQPDAPYTEPGEIATAAGMGSIATALNSTFVMALGDNFYDVGIHGDATNFRFTKTFEDVFTDESLQIPWYVIAGNHDHLGNVSAEIAYAKISKRWRFDDFYYTFSHSFPATDGSGGQTTLQVVYIDTVLLAGMVADHADKRAPLPGPANVHAAETQWQWISAQLKASKADYLLVAGHYPVWSICEHGPTRVLVDLLKPQLESNKVTAYVSGHDHCEEFLDEGKGPVYILTGNGDNCCYQDTNADKVPKGSLKWAVHSGNVPHNMIGGFASFNVTSQQMIVTYRDQSGAPLWTAPAIKPRPKA